MHFQFKIEYILRNLKYTFNGTTYIILSTLLYYNLFERMWSLPKSFIAFTFTVSFNVFFYNLTYLINRATLGFYIRYIYLLLFSLLLVLSSIGKSNWQEIPKMSMVYDVVFKNIYTIGNYTKYENVIIYTFAFFLILMLIKHLIKNQLFRYSNKFYYLFAFMFCSSYIFVDWRNGISSNTSSRELLAEDPILGPFVQKKNYGLNLLNSYISEKDNFKNWVLEKDAPDIVIINFDALRSDAFGKCIGDLPITPTFDSLIMYKLAFKAPYHTSSSSSSFNGILSTLYGNNAEYLPINKVGIHHILGQYGYQSNFILGGSHNHFMELKNHYGKVDQYFETTMVDKFFTGFREDDDNVIIKYLEKIHKLNQSKRHFYYFHVMAPHGGAYRNDAPMYKVINETLYLSEKEKSYYIGVNKADLILKKLLDYFYKSKTNVVLFISADHGEGLGVHKFIPIIGHNQQLTYETIQIPLIILDKNDKKTFRYKYSTQIDLLPTIVERCFSEFKLPKDKYPGNSLFSMPLKSRYTFHSFYVTKYEDFNFAIIKDSMGQAIEKYLYNPINGQEFIFNLKSDMVENDSIFDKEKINYYRHKKIDFLNPK
jgi:hypothetical protein